MPRAGTRREFLRVTGAGLGLAVAGLVELQQVEALLAGPAPADPLARARETLKRMILEHAAERDNPWLLIHGIRALGKEFPVEGAGEGPAITYLCKHYLRE